MPRRKSNLASDIYYFLQSGVEKLNSNNPAGAKASFLKALKHDPNNADTLHLIGLANNGLGQKSKGIQYIEKALKIGGENKQFLNNLGQILRGDGQIEYACAVYERALKLAPEDADVLNNLGNAYSDLKNSDKAIECFNSVIKENPNHVLSLYNLGVVFTQTNSFASAIACLEKVKTLAPGHFEARNNLGLCYLGIREQEKARKEIMQAITIAPEYAEAHYNLGNVYKDLGNWDEALASYNKAISIKPDYAEAHNNLGNVYNDLGSWDEALASYNKAISIKPDYAGAYNNLGSVYKNLGNWVEALASYNKAISIKPDYALAHSSLLFSEQYRPGHSAKSLFELHCKWDERHGQNFRLDWPIHGNVPEPERKLRIGFVSPDLGRHPVGYFTVLLLENLSGHKIETICYSDRIGDDLTKRIKSAANVWRDTHNVFDEDLSQIITSDEIDILIDLSGHSANNRLLVFARKPAPVQVTWAGYVGTTGLSAMDYLVSDMYSTREEEEPYYREKIIRMPDGWLCYEPPDFAPNVGPLPSNRNGSITFCSFNNPAKINEEVVSVWARILDGVVNSRLLIKYKGIDSKACIERLTAMFEAKGINQTRLVLEGPSPHAELLGRYNDVDIALDPFPYSGGLTTYEALWMGVPVITVPGETFASRHSQSHLSTIGLPELVARNRDDYVKLAVELANDGDRLTSLRANLRETMASSPICDGENFAAGFATIMREIWRNWCLSKG